MKLPLNTLLIALALGLALGQASPATAADAGATSAALPGDSLYHLQAGFTDLHGQSLQLRLFHLAPLLLISSRQDADRRRRSAWRKSMSHHRGINTKARRHGAKAEPAFSLGQSGWVSSASAR